MAWLRVLCRRLAVVDAAIGVEEAEDWFRRWWLPPVSLEGEAGRRPPGLVALMLPPRLWREEWWPGRGWDWDRDWRLEGREAVFLRDDVVVVDDVDVPGIAKGLGLWLRWAGGGGIATGMRLGVEWETGDERGEAKLAGSRWGS